MRSSVPSVASEVPVATFASVVGRISPRNPFDPSRLSSSGISGRSDAGSFRSFGFVEGVPSLLPLCARPWARDGAGFRTGNRGKGRKSVATCGLRVDGLGYPTESETLGTGGRGRGVDFLRHAAVALAPEENRSVFARHGARLVGAEKSRGASERLTAGRARRGAARVHELRAPDVLLKEGLRVGTALALGAVARKEHPFAREFLCETMRHQVPGLKRSRHRGHPAGKGKNAPLTARTPIERIVGGAEQRRRTVDRTRPARSGGRKERRVGGEKKRRYRVVPQGIELRQIREVPGCGFKAPRVGHGFRNEEPRRHVPVHVPEGRASTGFFRAARARVVARSGTLHGNPAQRGETPRVTHDFRRAQRLPKGEVEAPFDVDVGAAEAKGRRIRFDVGKVPRDGHGNGLPQDHREHARPTEVRDGVRHPSRAGPGGFTGGARALQERFAVPFRFVRQCPGLRFEVAYAIGRRKRPVRRFPIGSLGCRRLRRSPRRTEPGCDRRPKEEGEEDGARKHAERVESAGGFFAARFAVRNDFFGVHDAPPDLREISRYERLASP